jgi:hypothetical protein
MVQNTVLYYTREIFILEILFPDIECKIYHVHVGKLYLGSFKLGQLLCESVC